VIAISQTIADALCAAGVERKNIRVIHSGIDPNKFARAVDAAHPITADPPVIGTAAVLEERKGHRYLLEAARLLKDQGCRFKLIIAGEGSLRNRLQATIESFGMADDVTLAGFVSDMPGFLAQLDLFVLPSLHEGLGVAALEAMAAGKAVVASRVGGLAEVVLEGGTGLLAPPADPEGLARALATLLRDRDLRAAFGRRGVERVRDCFTLERMAARNEDCYYEVLAGCTS
jgi:glycosyltransferase involved in cell wall biosynthesis